MVVKMNKLIPGSAALAASCMLAVPNTAESADKSEPKTDPLTGMIVADDWQLVMAHCTGCHSAKQFLRQRGTRDNWKSMIRWMQKSQNLWQFDPDTEDRILTYLSENYAPDKAARRTPIPATLMPPNPYVSVLKKTFDAKRKAGQVPTSPASKKR